METIAIIESSRRKTLKSVLGSILFVAAGTWLFFISNKYDEPKTTIVKIIAVVCIIFFGTIAFWGVVKLFNKAPAISFYKHGFLDNSSFIGGDFILWDEVENISGSEVNKQQFISITLNDPQTYISKSNGLKKILRQQNQKHYKTPVHISAASLKETQESLLNIFHENWNNYKNSKSI